MKSRKRKVSTGLRINAFKACIPIFPADNKVKERREAYEAKFLMNLKPISMEQTRTIESSHSNLDILDRQNKTIFKIN